MKPLSKTDWLNKVPEVTLSFWIIKIMSTTVGETCADYLAVDAGLGQGVTSIGMALLLGLALFAQFRSRAYTPWIYWLSVVLGEHRRDPDHRCAHRSAGHQPVPQHRSVCRLAGGQFRCLVRR